MTDTPYSRFSADELILRDELAVDRTLLANERTLLAYLRAAIALVIAGITMMHFADQGWYFVVGSTCVPAGVIAGLIGIVRFRKMDRGIAMVRNQRKPSA